MSGDCGAGRQEVVQETAKINGEGGLFGDTMTSAQMCEIYAGLTPTGLLPPATATAKHTQYTALWYWLFIWLLPPLLIFNLYTGGAAVVPNRFYFGVYLARLTGKGFPPSVIQVEILRQWQPAQRH